MTNYFATAVLGYFLGSIPFGYILVRIFRGQDVRQIGSGNIGATNVARSSPMLGVLTLLLDACKGFMAVYLTSRFFAGQPSLLLIAALFAVIGHLYPMWLRFKGGKGVATGLGAFLLLTPKALLLMVGIFVVIVMASRYVSLGSITAVALFPLLAFFLDGYRATYALCIMTACSALIILKHAKNIRRLCDGTESRFGRARA
jgi:acyl phosphate:glycerol-3-phosphate acyltransferase